MKAYKTIKTVLTCLTMGSVQAWSAPTVDLANLGYGQYGDAVSYSLPIGNVSLASTPGAIKDLIVVATGSEGAEVTTNFAGMDNAYSTPNGVNGASFFYANPLTSRGTTGTVVNNGANTWDASLGALKTFLGGEQMVVLFNNNQINADGKASQSLAAWARLWLTNGSGTVLGTFELTNNNRPYDLISQGGGGNFLGDPLSYTAPGSGAGAPDAISGQNTDYVLSGGAICVNTSINPLYPVPVPCNSAGASAPISHNLGADHVAYALLFPELNSLMDGLFDKLSDADLAAYTLHADIRLGCGMKTVTSTQRGNRTVYAYGSQAYGASPSCAIADNNGWATGLNNGYEQIFIGTARVRDDNPNPVPLPGTLTLLAVAGAAAGWGGRRRAQPAWA